ncbi:DnaJ homolog subfamily C member 10 [Linum perenne]
MAGDSSKPPTSSMASRIKAYSVPLLLFSLSLFYQLAVLPNSFPPSHYDVLGIKRFSSVEEVKDAYEKLSSNWKSGEEVPTTVDFLKVQYAFELLKNPTWKRDYDLFGIDEQLDLLETAKVQYAESGFSDVDLPLLDDTFSGDLALDGISSWDIASNNSKPLLLLVYSKGSNRCAKFLETWKRIASFLDGTANIGAVEVGDIEIAASFAERKPTGQFFFRNGLPSLVALPLGCRTSDCLVRFEGDLSVDAVTDWFATSVLGLPRILYYTKETLAQNFMAKSGPHKVKVIFFSKTGERAAPFVRQAAKEYWAHASFAFVLWREEDFSFWWNSFEVESAPAVVFIKDPGFKPLVFHGALNNSLLLDLMENNKEHELPQLRSATSMKLGCDARGYSRAGSDTVSWYCVIVAGRLSLELNKMRQTLRRVKELQSGGDHLDVDKEQTSSLVNAIESKRLTFAWLDGEAQEKYCSFYLHSETSYDTCGPRRDMADVPRLFLVRYKRNDSEASIEDEKTQKNKWHALLHEDVDPASQLVARYNGSSEIPEIIKWISQTISDGESKDLPFYRTRTPELVPEDSEPIWSRGAQSVLSKSVGIKHSFRRVMSRVSDHIGDPRIGPMLLLGALMSFGTIWLSRSQKKQKPRTRPGQQKESTTKDEAGTRRRQGSTNASKRDRPPSMTDVEPRDAYEMPFSDSDSE